MNFQPNELVNTTNSDNRNWSEICSQLLSNIWNTNNVNSILIDLSNLLVRAGSNSSTRKYLLDKVRLYLQCLKLNVTSIKSQLSQFKKDENINWINIQTPDFIIINSKVVVLLNSSKDNIIETLLTRATEFEAWTMESNLILIWLESYLNISDY